MTYREFLEQKIDVAPLSGLEVDESELNPVLKPHQRVSVLWALRGGLMTVPYMAVKMQRCGVGIELNPDYFRDGVGYLQEADEAGKMFTLFDLAGSL